MQCPSCGFENMPGQQQCASCSTSLSAGPKPESVMPPRARNRTWRQQARYLVDDVPVVTSAGRWLASQRDRVSSGTRRAAAWTWLSPGALGLILLSGIPGFSHFFIVGRRYAGAILFLCAAASVLLAAVLHKTNYCDVLVWSTIGLSAWSMYVAVDHIRPSSRTVVDRLCACAGVWMLILALYTGGYFVLRLALSPVAMTVRVNVPVANSGLYDGDTALILRRGPFHRGETVLGQIRWHNQNIPGIGPLIGMPGDRLVLSDRLYVNDRPYKVALPRLAGEHNEYRPYSAQESAQIRLGRDQYWIMPNLNAAPGPQTILETGVVRLSDMTGRVIAVTAPAPHRKLMHPANMEYAE